MERTKRLRRVFRGTQWLVDAHGCRPESLRSRATLGRLFLSLVRELELHPVGRARFRVFPPPGGISALLMLTESHVSCHTFPETGYCALDLYCCSPRSEWPWRARLTELLGAKRIEVRRLARPRRRREGRR